MASSPKAPAAVDTTGAAQATALSNLNFANIATASNRVNQNNQNGSVRWTSEDSYDQGAHARAIADWEKADPKTRGNAPTKNEFISKTWTQTETPNATLRKTAADQQLAGEYLASAARNKANEARASLNKTANMPQVQDYLKNLPKQDTSTIKTVKAYDSNAKLSTDLAGGLDRLNVADTKKVGAFNSQNTNLDTNLTDNLGNVGTVNNVNTKVNTFNGKTNLDTNLTDNLKNVGTIKDVGQFASGQKLDTNVNDNLAGVKALNQDGVSQMGAFAYKGQDIQNQINSKAKLDTNLADNLSANGVNMRQQQFNDGGRRVQTDVPQFDESVSDKYAKAAYESQMAFMRDDMAGARNMEANRMALQGLGVDSEAAKGAMSAVYNSQAKQLNQLANQSVLTGADIARGNYGAQLQGVQARNAAEAQRFGQQQDAFNTNLAANNQAFSQNQALFNSNNAANQAQFENDAQRAQFANAAQAQRFGQQNQAYANNLNAKQFNQSVINDTNAARNTAFNQALTKFNTNNDARAQQFGMDQSAFNTNAAATAQNNQAQQARYGQAVESAKFGNEAQLQQFNTQNQAYQNYLAGLGMNADLVNQNNQNQNQRYNQALTSFQAGNAAKDAQFNQNVDRFNAGVQQATTNAQLQQMDNSNAMQQQAWRANNLNFTNQARLQQEAINQQDYQNQLSAAQMNMGIRDSNNNLRTQAMQDALTRYSAMSAQATDNRYRALNEYQALMNGTSPVGPNQFQNYAQQATTGGVDYAGAQQNMIAQQNARYQAGAAQANAVNSSLASLAGTAGMLAFMSDERLKKNIQPTGETDSGRKTYTWEWNKQGEALGMKGKAHGVLAQENRDISVKDPMTGYLAVDYGRVNQKKKK